MNYPIKTKKITCTSRYGERSYKYQGKKIKDFHNGIDLIDADRNPNVEILAFADGEVIGVRKTGSQYGVGCYVRIKHSNGYQTLYYHLKSKSIVVNVGDKVKKNQKIGIIGTTGQSTGIHLHFQIDKGSSATSIDPYDYVFGNKEFIQEPKPTPAPVTTKITVGDTVIVNGVGTASSTGTGAKTREFKNTKMKVIMISGNTSRPNRYALNIYNQGTNNDARSVSAWFREQDIKKK